MITFISSVRRVIDTNVVTKSVAVCASLLVLAANLFFVASSEVEVNAPGFDDGGGWGSSFSNDDSWGSSFSNDDSWSSASSVDSGWGSSFSNDDAWGTAFNNQDDAWGSAFSN
ncbi:MAG: hypothetical protein RI911_864, partial [Candidatus Parcubacteria bacterium]